MEELERLGITEETVIEKLSSSYKGWLCQVEDSVVVGFCIADRATGELWVIAVLPDFEDKGIGNGLMALAEEWLWESGCDRAWLTTDVDMMLRAYGFYRNRGWVDWKVENGLRWMQLFSPRARDGLASFVPVVRGFHARSDHVDGNEQGAHSFASLECPSC